MTTNSRKNKWLILAISGVLIAAPIFIFPRQLGLNLATGSFIYAVVEVIYYSFIFFLLSQQANLFRLVQGAGLTFIYRILLGTVFGVVISIFYDMNLGAALSLGISRYLPAILLQVIAAPFVMRPVFLSIVDPNPARKKQQTRKYPPIFTPNSGEASNDSARQTAQNSHLHASNNLAEPHSINASSTHDTNSFDRAVRYLGEHHSVLLAVVVDNEGLLLASYRRGQIDPEIWAPLSILLHSNVQHVLDRNEKNVRTERLDLSYGSKKLSIHRSEHFNLMVLADHDEDELINIRFAQAVELIRKYFSERYGAFLVPGPEEQYVSNS